MKVTSLILLLFVAIGAFAQDVFEEQNAITIKKHKVKSMTTWNHAFKEGKPAETGYKNAFAKYDLRGNQTELISYKSTGKVFTMESFKFDEADNNTGYVRYDGSQDKVTFKKLFKYDADGNKIKEVGFDGASNYKNNYIYVNGKLSEIHYFMADLLYQKRVFKYTGNTAEISVLDADGNLEFKMAQQYDAKGNLLEDIEFKPQSEEVAKKYVYTYNSAGKKKTEEKYEYGFFKYKQTFSYNGNDKLVLVKQQKGQSPEFEMKKFIYNADGTLKEEAWRKRDGKPFSTKTYTYDEKGICKEAVCFYASYKYKVLFKYTYEY